MDGLTIKHCFIFNPTLKSPKTKPSDDEQQDAKLLYYHPTTEELLIKRSNIGIIEGTLSFMDSFEKSNTSFLLTELNKFYFVANNYESNFLLVFILEKKAPMFSYYQDITAKKKWLKCLLDNFYNMFILFHHSFSDFFLSKETPQIHLDLTESKLAVIEDYTNTFVEYLNEGMKLPFFDYLVYFPLSDQLQANLLLNIQRLTEKIPDMIMSSIIYKGHIIHNQLPLETFSLLYNLFYNVYDFKSKFSSFKEPPDEIIQTIQIKETTEKEKENSNKLSDSAVKTPFRKGFKFNENNNGFIIGIRKDKDTINNNYHVFIPTIHIKQTDEKYKLLVYYYNGMCIFMFFDEKLNIQNRITQIESKVNKYVERYFKENIEKLETPYKIKISSNDSIFYAYSNNANKSLKLSSMFNNKKTRMLDLEKFDIFQKALLVNNDVKMTSLTKFKGFYIYYLNSCERNIVFIYNDSINLTQLRKLIEENKKALFDFIYII